MASYVYFKCFNEMMFLNNNEKKKKANAISYEIDDPSIRLVIWVVTLANGK
mgnify:CR=1 FL=1